MIGFYWQNNVSPWEIPVLITQRVEVALVTTEKPCTAHSACVLYPSVQSDSRCPHVAAELLSHVTSRTGSWTLSRRVKFERSHMATILDSPAFSNCKFSLICARSPYLLQQASFKYGWNPEACTIQITAFKFNPMKKTWRVLTKNPDDKKLKGSGRHVLGIRE